MAAHPDFIDHILRVHQYSTTTGVTFIQHGLAKSMNSEPVMQEVSQMVKQFDERRQRIMYEIDQIPGLSYVRPNGAFYIFVNVSGTGLTGDAFSRELLMTHDVATVPASAFGKGYDDYVRMSYATTKENIIKGFERIRRFVQRLNEEKRD